jgi:DNA-binding MarR family transcriptional regulator
MADTTIRNFRKMLRSLERQVELTLAAQTECCGVTPAQCHLLLEAGETKEASIGELAASLELDASTLSRTVDGLVKAGLLSRKEDSANRRRQLVTLSAAGREKVDYIDDVCDRYYAGLLGSLTEAEAATLREALPLLVKLLRSWRLSGQGSSCCAAPAEETP